MKYFKIYKQCVTVAKAYHELTFDQYSAAICERAYEQVHYDPDDLVAFESRLAVFFEKADEQAATDYGFDCGDFTLHIASDDADMYDFKRANC